MRGGKSIELQPFDAAEYLADESTIAEFLNASAEMGDAAVLLDAFAAVARARGMAELAKKAGLGRESLYKARSPGAQPRYETIFKLAQALGLNLHFSAPPAAPAKKARASTRRAPSVKAPTRTPRTRSKAPVGQRAVARNGRS